MPDSVLAAQLYSLRDFCQTLDDFRTSMNKVKEIGYQAVQISGIGADLDAKDVGAICDDLGLTICATHMSWDRFMNDLDGVIADHKTWHCTHSAIGGLFGDEWASAGAVKTFADQLHEVAPKLAAEGIDFSYHNHSHELVKYDGQTWLKMLMDQVPVDELKMEIDTYWIQHGGGDPAAWVRDCQGRIPLLHLKDMIVTIEREQRFAEIGEGNLNWDSILQAAKDAGVEWYIIEQDSCYERDPFESMAISFRNCKAMGLN